MKFSTQERQQDETLEFADLSISRHDTGSAVQKSKSLSPDKRLTFDSVAHSSGPYQVAGLKNLITGSNSVTTQQEYGIGGICSEKPGEHANLMSLTVVLVFGKLVCRGLYFYFNLGNTVDRRISFLKEIANNEAAFVLMMLIVILMNKVKVHLIYVRNQQVAGFWVRQVFTLCYVIIFWLYLWNCLQALHCKDGAKYAIFVLQISFLVMTSIGSGLTARTLY